MTSTPLRPMPRPITEAQPTPPAPSTRANRPPVDPAGWGFSRLLWAPHRVAFFAGMTALVLSALWWWLVQLDRLGWGVGLPWAVPSTLVHAALMVFGFFPLFFVGFMFTAGPKWLGVLPPPASALLAPLVLQCVGWLVWVLAGSLHGPAVVWALAGVSLGWSWNCAQFGHLWRVSRAPDRLHAGLVMGACWVGAACLAGLLWATARHDWAWALRLVSTGLWLCVVPVFLVVVHRMLPFFTSSALPMVRVWRPFWVLWFLLAIAALETAAVWLPWALNALSLSGSRAARGWMLAQGLVELAGGSVVLWLACVWGLVQSLKVRLLAMLHAGFLWFGLALVLSAASQLLGLAQGVPVLGLGALHALTLGFLGSMLVAMVTRVSCGHSGRPLVADAWVWGVFWVLQVTTVLRVLSALAGAPVWLTPLVATLWLAVAAAWAARLLGWYVRARADGRPD